MHATMPPIDSPAAQGPMCPSPLAVISAGSGTVGGSVGAGANVIGGGAVVVAFGTVVVARGNVRGGETVVAVDAFVVVMALVVGTAVVSGGLVVSTTVGGAAAVVGCVVGCVAGGPGAAPAGPTAPSRAMPPPTKASATAAVIRRITSLPNPTAPGPIDSTRADGATTSSFRRDHPAGFGPATCGGERRSAAPAPRPAGLASPRSPTSASRRPR